MAFGFAGAAAGASDALQQLLMERRKAFLEQQEMAMREEAAKRQQQQFEQNIAMQQQNMGLQQRRFDADEADRQYTRSRDEAEDAAKLADTQQFESLVQGLPEQVRPIVQLRKRGVTVDQHMLETPEAHQAHLTAEQQAADKREIDNYTAKKRIDLQLRPPTAASTEQEWVIRNGQVTPIRKGTAQPGDKPYEKSGGGSGGRGVLSGDANRIAELRSSLDDLKTLRQTIAAPGESGATGLRAQVGAWVPNPITNLTGLGVSAKQKQAVIDRVKQVIGKALEGGVLRKEDEAKYAKILPTIGDNDQVVLTKLQGLDTAIQQRLGQTLEALEQAGYNVSGFQGGRGGGGGTADTDALLDELLGTGR